MLRATARAEVAAEDFYKPNKPYICAAHVIGIADPAMYRQELICQRGESQKLKDRWTLRLKIDGPEVGDLSEAEALYNAQDTLTYERARFRADYAARDITTAADVEKRMLRIAVARAVVVRQKI